MAVSSNSAARFPDRCFRITQICSCYPERSSVYSSLNGPVTFEKKSNLSFSAMDNFHSSIPHFGEMEFDFREIWSFSFHSHFQPLSPPLVSSLSFSLNPVSHCCCCIGCIPASFILRSSPHTLPLLLVLPIGVIFPPFLIFSHRELERPRPLTAVSGSVPW